MAGQRPTLSYGSIFDAIFYLQIVRVKLAVLSEQGNRNDERHASARRRGATHAASAGLV
jgi:hypothetical protein